MNANDYSGRISREVRFTGLFKPGMAPSPPFKPKQSALFTFANWANLAISPSGSRTKTGTRSGVVTGVGAVRRCLGPVTGAVRPRFGTEKRRRDDLVRPARIPQHLATTHSRERLMPGRW